MDSDGDGEGDLRGLLSRMDHLIALNIDAIWLTPFYPSPRLDGGYDVADPRGVDPRFGSLDDVRELIGLCHSNGIKVLVDVVPNHVSWEHRWFREALASPVGSAARARFHFRDGKGENGELPPNNWVSVFGGPTWTRITEPDGTPGQWYLHVFDTSQPDLNWEHPQVREDALETLRFWLDLGVDGFRVDVAFGLVKDMTYADHPDPEGVIRAMRLDLAGPLEPGQADPRAVLRTAPFFDREEVHEIYREWRKVLDSYDGDRMAVAEAWAWPVERAMAYARPDELSQTFCFDFLIVQWNARHIRRTAEQVLSATSAMSAPPTWVLCNHDTPRVASRLGGGEPGVAKARALALIAHALPGAVYVFQGEELGLQDVFIPEDRRQDPIWQRSGFTDPGRDGARVPLPWSGTEAPFGFSAASVEPWLPQPVEWKTLTAQAQEGLKHSTLTLYRTLLGLRRTHPAFANPDAEVTFFDAGADVVLFRRADSLWVAANTGPESATVSITAAALLVASSAEVEFDGAAVTLPPHTAAWLG